MQPHMRAHAQCSITPSTPCCPGIASSSYPSYSHRHLHPTSVARDQPGGGPHGLSSARWSSPRANLGQGRSRRARLSVSAVASPYEPQPTTRPVAGALMKEDFTKFVQFFRQASAYIEGHRGRAFVIVLPGSVTSNPALFKTAMSLGVKVVVVAGTQHQIDELLIKRGLQPLYISGYRITSKESMDIVIEAAGKVRTNAEQYLSKGPAIPMIRRHTKGDGEIHFQPAIRAVSGNFVTAKRRGVIDGIDYGLTGEVRFVLREDIMRQLDSNNIVLLSNLVESGADKLTFLHDQTELENLPSWLPLSSAQDLLLHRLKVSVDDNNNDSCEDASEELSDGATQVPMPSSLPNVFTPTEASVTARRVLSSMQPHEIMENLDIWDGVGTMIPADFYKGETVMAMVMVINGIRRALPGDLDGVAGLLEPLVKAGVLVKRSRDDIANMLPDFIVIDRESKGVVLGVGWSAVVMIFLFMLPDFIVIGRESK
eukprot:gene30535-35564_t